MMSEKQQPQNNRHWKEKDELKSALFSKNPKNKIITEVYMQNRYQILKEHPQ